MPETAEQYYARVRAHADDQGRLQPVRETLHGWDVFPFEFESLAYKPLQPLSAEVPRQGEDPATCWCAKGTDPAQHPRAVWWDDDWQLTYNDYSSMPVELLLSPRFHADLPDLTPEQAGEFGRLQVALAAAVEALPSVARAQFNKWGDGAAHLHLAVLGRPAGMPQLRGSGLVLWTEGMPALPEDVLRENALFVARALRDRLGRGEVPAAQ